MTTFSTLQRRRRELIKSLVDFSCGLDEKTVEMIVTYGECMLNQDKEAITKTTFISEMADQFKLTSLYMISLVFEVLRQGQPPASKTMKNTIPLEQFCKLICIFMTHNIDLKIDFVFNVYDIDHDNAVTRTEVYSMLKPTIPQEDDEQEDMLKELIELVMKVVDRDGNGSIDREEFRLLVKKDVLYIELLGQCLPEDRIIRRFANKLANKSTYQVRELFEAEQSLKIFRDLVPKKSDLPQNVKLDF